MVGEADRRAMEKEESLERVFTEDDHQLQAILNDFQTENNSRASDLQKLRQTEKSFQSSVKDKREALGILQNRRGEAFALQQDLEIKRQEEHSLMQQIAESYNLTLPSSTSSSSSLSRGVELFLKQFDTKIENLTKENEKKLTKAMKDLEIAQKKTRQAQLDLQQITMEIGNDDRELSRIERERHLLRTELNTFDSLSQRNARPQAEAEVKQVPCSLSSLSSSSPPPRQLKSGNHSMQLSM
jgi:DNA repair exonuclease SbcCD ATPase subunit